LPFFKKFEFLEGDYTKMVTVQGLLVLDKLTNWTNSHIGQTHKSEKNCVWSFWQGLLALDKLTNWTNSHIGQTHKSEKIVYEASDGVYWYWTNSQKWKKCVWENMCISVKELRYAPVLRTSTASQPFGLLARFALKIKLFFTKLILLYLGNGRGCKIFWILEFYSYTVTQFRSLKQHTRWNLVQNRLISRILWEKWWERKFHNFSLC